MNNQHFLILVIALGISLTQANAQQVSTVPDSAAIFQAQQLQQTDRKAGSANMHPDAQWFPGAGLGLFIHWGMTAVNATGDLSWNMLANKPWKDATITPNNYYKQLDKWLPEKTPDYEHKRHEYLRNQVTELLSNYGKIDLMWFDGGRGEVPNKLVRTLQPGIVINRRNGAEGGDYGDTKGILPQKRFSGWFETCETCWPSRKWAYTEDAGWDTAAEVITSLVKLRAWGGNLLANVGPKASGEVPQQALSAWKEMARWMKHSREAVIGANAGPWPADVNTPVTTNDGVAYIHLLPGEEIEVVWNNAPEPQKAFMLRTKKNLSFSYKNGILKMKIPKTDRTNNVDVVKLVIR